MTGKKDGQQSFLGNQYRVEGDFSPLIRLAQLFSKKQADEKQKYGDEPEMPAK